MLITIGSIFGAKGVESWPEIHILVQPPTTFLDTYYKKNLWAAAQSWQKQSLL